MLTYILGPSHTSLGAAHTAHTISGATHTCSIFFKCSHYLCSYSHLQYFLNDAHTILAATHLQNFFNDAHTSLGATHTCNIFLMMLTLDWELLTLLTLSQELLTLAVFFFKCSHYFGSYSHLQKFFNDAHTI